MTLKRIITLFVFCLQTLLSHSQDTALVISTVDKDLNSSRKTISDVLSDSKLMYLHSLTPFRDVIKKMQIQAILQLLQPRNPVLEL